MSNPLEAVLCYPYYYIWAVTVPVVVALALYLAKPKQLMTVVNGQNVLDGKKFFQWLLVASAVAWGGLYFYVQSKPGKAEYCISRRLLA